MAEPVKATCDKFHKVFELFGICHRAYSGMVMDEAAITQLGMGFLGGYILLVIQFVFCRIGYKELHGLLQDQFSQGKLPQRISAAQNALARRAHDGVAQDSWPWDRIHGRTGSREHSCSP